MLNDLILSDLIFRERRQQNEWYLEDMLSAKVRTFKHNDKVVDQLGNVGDVVWSNEGSTCVELADGKQHFCNTASLVTMEEYLRM